MAKEKFDRSKPHVNIGTLGHVDHGKTRFSPRPRVAMQTTLLSRTSTRLPKSVSVVLPFL